MLRGSFSRGPVVVVLVVLEEPKGGRMDVKPRSEMHWMRGRLAAMKLPLGTGASVISQGSWPPRPEELECGRSPIRTPFLLTSYGRSPAARSPRSRGQGLREEDLEEVRIGQDARV